MVNCLEASEGLRVKQLCLTNAAFTGSWAEAAFQTAATVADKRLRDPYGLKPCTLTTGLHVQSWEISQPLNVLVMWISWLLNCALKPPQ